MKFITRRQSFTVIETLMILAIIGILVTILISTTASAKIKARDSQRKLALYNLSLAVVLYRQASPQKLYPVGENAMCNGDLGKNWKQFGEELKPHLSAIPRDPFYSTCSSRTKEPWYKFPYRDTDYYYASTNTPPQYSIWTALESPTDPARNGTSDMTGKYSSLYYYDKIPAGNSARDNRPNLYGVGCRYIKRSFTHSACVDY